MGWDVSDRLAKGRTQLQTTGISGPDARGILSTDSYASGKTETQEAYQDVSTSDARDGQGWSTERRSDEYSARWTALPTSTAEELQIPWVLFRKRVRLDHLSRKERRDVHQGRCEEGSGPPDYLP